MLGSIDVTASALVAQRQRMNTIAGNIANTHTTLDENGEPNPYQRRFVTFHVDQSSRSSEGGGPVGYEVHVDQNTQPRRVFQPQHEHADADGYVNYPAIDMVTEFVNALDASRAYEANVAAFDLTKSMTERTLGILA